MHASGASGQIQHLVRVSGAVTLGGKLGGGAALASPPFLCPIPRLLPPFLGCSMGIPSHAALVFLPGLIPFIFPSASALN